MGQEKLTYSHNETNFGTKQGDFLGQENSILSHIKTNLVTKCDVFFGTGEEDFEL